MLLLILLCVTPLTIDAESQNSEQEIFMKGGQSASTCRCEGQCSKNWSQLVCLTTWNGTKEKCQPMTGGMPRYRTIKNEECVSYCAYFNNDNVQRCVTSKSRCEQCSTKIALEAKRTRETYDKYKTCSSECTTRAYDYNWCHVPNDTWDYRWQYCRANVITHTINYPTEDGKSVCATRCKLDGSWDSPKCYTGAGEWQSCILNPSYNSTLAAIDRHLKLHCSFGEYENEGKGYNVCTRRRHRRQNELYFECDAADVDKIVTSHRSNNPTVVLRVANPNNMITTDKNPILSYTIFPTLSYFSANSDPIDLPLVVTALLTNHTLAPVGERDAFTNRVDANYNGMDRNLQHLNYDERGHILASRLGGPMETFNIFPQTWRMNRGRNSMWYGLEVDLDRFLRNHGHRYVLFTAVLSYTTDLNEILVHRPSAIMLRVRAYDNGQMVHLDGTPVTRTRPNTLESMFFSNDPNHSCEPLPAMTPKRRG